MKIKVNNIEYDVEKLSNGKWSLPKNYENGDKTITVSALNIDGNRVGTEDSLGRNNKLDVSDTNTVGDWGMKALDQSERIDGRYPAQTFIDSKVAERLDLQSGVCGAFAPVKSGQKGFGGEIYGKFETSGDDGKTFYGSLDGCSKILHKCNYTDEDYDLYNYEPKVSASERSAGCDDREAINVNDGRNTPIDNPYQRGETLRVNTHPTLKPVALNEKILKLFKTPNDQKICYPFAGAGSEIIGGIKAGFDNWCGCEISQEYVDIANARIKYWKEEMTTQTSIFDFID